ncbi:MAG: sugar ABC transporter permease [Myxococcota bacterium]|jgi:arabinogalactan oligomer/maltooligosaccharide transport system permease protein|nr:sugar ABC transporter permease [Myxococcota bacterium]
MRKVRWYHQVLAQVVLVLVSVVTLYPVLWVVKMALKTGQGFAMTVNPLPTEFSLENFAYVIGRTDKDGTWLFGYQLFNSVVISVATTLIGVFLACTGAYAFSRFRFPGRQAGLMSFLVTQMFPGVLMMIPLFVILQKLGAITGGVVGLNSIWGLVMVYSTTAIPFCVWMLKGYFDTIPKELEESALIDGATQLQIFTRIILPLARPAIAVTALFSFMTGWNEFILAATFMNSETAYTLPVTLRSYVGSYSTEWGHFAAGAIIVSVPVMALFFALQKYLVGGLTAGAVKG